VDNSEHKAPILALQKDIQTLFQELKKREKAVAEVVNNRSLAGSELWRVVNEYADYFRDVALPQVRPMNEKIVELANNVQQEADRRLKAAKSRAEQSAHFAIVLYVIGSVLALTGQTFDKLQKSSPSTQSNSTNSSQPVR
jgi:hypothetical protein